MATDISSEVRPASAYTPTTVSRTPTIEKQRVSRSGEDASGTWLPKAGGAGGIDGLREPKHRGEPIDISHLGRAFDNIEVKLSSIGETIAKCTQLMKIMNDKNKKAAQDLAVNQELAGADKMMKAAATRKQAAVTGAAGTFVTGGMGMVGGGAAGRQAVKGGTAGKAAADMKHEFETFSSVSPEALQARQNLQDKFDVMHAHALVGPLPAGAVAPVLPAGRTPQQELAHLSAQLKRYTPEGLAKTSKDASHLEAESKKLIEVAHQLSALIQGLAQLSGKGPTDTKAAYDHAIAEQQDATAKQEQAGSTGANTTADQMQAMAQSMQNTAQAALEYLQAIIKAQADSTHEAIA